MKRYYIVHEDGSAYSAILTTDDVHGVQALLQHAACGIKRFTETTGWDSIEDAWRGLAVYSEAIKPSMHARFPGLMNTSPARVYAKPGCYNESRARFGFEQLTVYVPAHGDIVLMKRDLREDNRECVAYASYDASEPGKRLKEEGETHWFQGTLENNADCMAEFIPYVMKALYNEPDAVAEVLL